MGNGEGGTVGTLVEVFSPIQVQMGCMQDSVLVAMKSCHNSIW